MTSKTFVSGTVIDKDWLNDVDAATYEGGAIYTPAGTGAVATTVQADLRRFMKAPEHFGAVGDGVTDDSVAIGLWLTAANGAWARPTSGKLYRITSIMTSLTAKEIRISGDDNCFDASNHTLSAGQKWAGFLLDGANTTISGGWDTAANTLTWTGRVKGLKNIVLCTTNAKYAIVDQFSSAEIHGIHLQGFSDHGIVSTGSVFSSLRDISGYNVGLGKGASGSFNSGAFINGCGLHTIGSCISGVAGNYVGARAFGSGNFSSTLDVQNIFFDTVSTQTTSCKGAIICNTRSSSFKNFGTYSGVFIENSYVDFESPHLETYATGGAVASDGNPQSLVILNSVVTTTTYAGGSTYEPLWLRTTAFGASTDYWGYDLDYGSRKQISRLGIGELILGEKLQVGSTQTQHVAALGTAANPLLYWDSTVNALRGSKGSSFQAVIGMPIVITGTVANGAFADMVSNTVCPSVDLGSGPGGIYEIDVQLYNSGTGQIYYSGTWRGVKSIQIDNFTTRFYKLASIDNNMPAGGMTVTENGAGPYTLRITNNTAFTWAYAVTSRLINAALPAAM